MYMGNQPWNCTDVGLDSRPVLRKGRELHFNKNPTKLENEKDGHMCVTSREAVASRDVRYGWDLG